MTQARPLPFRLPQHALAHFAQRTPSATALSFPRSGGSLTFAAWHARSDALARGLLDLGVAPGTTIGLLAENRVEWPVVQLACAKLGSMMVPLNTHYRSEDLGYALGQSRVEVLFLSRSFRSNAYLEMAIALQPQLAHLARIVCLDSATDVVSYADIVASGSDSKTALPEVSPNAPASLQYTSGTTGFPKGAVLSHAAMMRNGWNSFERLHATADDRYTSIIPLFHCAGCIFGILGALTHGARYVGVPAFDPESMFEVIATERCTLLTGVPTSYLAMLRHPARSLYDLSSLRAGTCGGADCNVDVMKQCAEAFPIPGLAQVYGQTECGTIIALGEATDPERFDTCGFPLDGLEVRATDIRSRSPLPPSELGQLEVRGVTLMDGYFENPAATAETLDSEGWLQTGDLGYVTAEGRVVVAGGRLRDMLIRGGENIYPVEIENTLARHPAVGEVAVLGVPDDYYGEIPVAVIRLRGDVSAAELGQHCGERIARYKVPAHYYVTETYPLTSSGKVRKQELREWIRAGKLTALV
jgi:acyl-CoA synthetase (AMP-forming)/AMP-acid ligase II